MLTSENTAVVLDSTADLPDFASRFANFRMVPLTVSFGDTDYRDYVDLGPARFYEQLASSKELPKTAAPSPFAFAETYRELLDGAYEHVVSLQLSGKLSATLDAARTAAAELGDRVTVLDSCTACAAIALCALKIAELLERGTDLDAIRGYAGRFTRESRLLFAVETLEYLQRGGRIGKASALLGAMLSVRPILSLQAGEVVPIDRVRGASKVVARFADELERTTPARGPLRVAIAHAMAPARAVELGEMVRSVRPEATLELLTPIGAVLGVYAGPGAFGMAWVAEEPTRARAELPPVSPRVAA
jgi:DegV family protein with EDD domain